MKKGLVIGIIMAVSLLPASAKEGGDYSCSDIVGTVAFMMKAAEDCNRAWLTNKAYLSVLRAAHNCLPNMTDTLQEKQVGRGFSSWYALVSRVGEAEACNQARAIMHRLIEKCHHG
jgi:hypothetical protein